MEAAPKFSAVQKSRGSWFGLSLAVATMAVSSAGAARATDGWYGRADIGLSLDGAAEMSASQPLGADAALDTAALGAAALGFAREDGWRFELELSRRENDLDGAALLDPGGSIESTALLVNLYRDFGGERVTPYAGFGFGMAEVDLQTASTLSLIPGSVDDAEVTFAYQVLAGVAVSLSPSIDLDIGYRYFAAPGFEGTGFVASGPSPFPPSIPAPVDADMSQHALTIGVRFDF